jgi:GH24 family phage-related lysozyme (muramidase)
MSLVSRQLVDFVKKFEGFSATPYLDPVGVKTLGYGMTGAEIKGLESVTEEQASKMLEDLLNNRYAAPLKADLDSKGVQLNQNQFDALASMAYNVGVNGVLGSTLYKNICNGVRDKDTITSNFQMWCMAGGKRLEGLYRRRTEEAEMFLKDVEVHQTPADNWVSRLQAECNAQGYSKQTVDGIPGKNTLAGCPLLKYGSRGNITKLLQEKLGISTDGIFGNQTLQAVQNFQKAHGLQPDGIVGQNTWRKLLGL